MCKTLPNASKVGQPGVLVPQLVLRKAGARHYRKYLYTYKKKKSHTTIKKKKNTTSTAWYNNMPWNVIGFIIIYYNLKNVLLSTRDRKCFHLTYGKHAVIICTTKKKIGVYFLFINGMITWGYFAMVIFLARCTLRFASFLLWIFFPPLFAEKENSYIHLQEVSFSHGAYTAIIFFPQQ